MMIFIVNCVTNSLRDCGCSLNISYNSVCIAISIFITWYANYLIYYQVGMTLRNVYPSWMAKVISLCDFGI